MLHHAPTRVPSLLALALALGACPGDDGPQDTTPADTTTTGPDATAGPDTDAPTTTVADSSGGETEVPGCAEDCPEGETCMNTGRGFQCQCGPTSCPSGLECDAEGHCSGLVWPNDASWANSDPWIAQHHQEITQMRPRVLAINYVNARTMEDMAGHMQQMRDVIAESSRFHGYADPSAPAFLEYELAYLADLRDETPPPDWPYNNSTRYPREDPVDGYWSFDYERLFDEEHAQWLGIEDPSSPGTNLTLCEAIDQGLVHEVWIYGDADVPDVNAAEMLELKPYYDEDGNRLPGDMDRCVGNGCFDEEDTIPCSRSVRVAWFNNTRGPGCFLESLSHAFEGMGRRGSTVLPYLSRYFPEFAGMQLDTDYGLPIDSWYACPYGLPCLSYPSETSVTYDVSPGVQGTIEGYDPACGNVHWPPNARQHYDLAGTDAVQSSCTHWRDGTGLTEAYDGSQHTAYSSLAPDCMGPFLVWWRQNIPGRHSGVLDDDGAPMRNWWPFLFY